MNELIVATIIFCSWPGGDGWTIHTTMPSIEACESRQADAIRREALPPNERALEDQRRLWWVNEYHDSYNYDVNLHEADRPRPWYSRFWRWIKGGDGE